jgi:hypothetical protein
MEDMLEIEMIHYLFAMECASTLNHCRAQFVQSIPRAGDSIESIHIPLVLPAPYIDACKFYSDSWWSEKAKRSSVIRLLFWFRLAAFQLYQTSITTISSRVRYRVTGLAI